MFLQPKKTKYRKHNKGRLSELDYKSSDLKFGTFGLKALEAGCVSSKQIEATRQAITRKIKRNGRVWVRIFPDLSISSKPIEVRMGKGKGAPNHWVARIGGGTIVFEIDGISEKSAKIALHTGSTKLPIKTRVTL
jgi:large subunit ribosomal protein L16